MLALLWPRFELILEMNVQSVRSTDPQRLGGLDTRPHYITRRYAEFSSALVSINQTIPNERTLQLLGQLQVGQLQVGTAAAAGTAAGGAGPDRFASGEGPGTQLLNLLLSFRFCRWRWRTLSSAWLRSSPPGRSSSCF